MPDEPDKSTGHKTLIGMKVGAFLGVFGGAIAGAIVGDGAISEVIIAGTIL